MPRAALSIFHSTVEGAVEKPESTIFVLAKQQGFNGLYFRAPCSLNCEIALRSGIDKQWGNCLGLLPVDGRKGWPK
jgi:hypothetical protein